MKNKFLPIGTVCEIKGNDKKVMITGYLVNAFNNTLKRYDYMGIVYPEGMLANNRTCLFDSEDIISVVYIGYESKEYEKFSGLLNDYSVVDKEDIKTKFKKGNGTFTTSNDSFSKLVFDENGVVMFAQQANDFESDFVFDDSGYVIRENKKDVVNPFLIKDDYEFDENGVVVKDKKNKPTKTTVKDGYEFDENGYVVSAN